MNNSIFKTFFLSLCIIANTSFAQAQTASILPPAKTQYLDNNGKPLTSGKVYNYIPSTTTFKTTWQDAAETIPNTNPVILDAGGRAKILGDGSYRQIVKDRYDNIIWDAVTSSTGSGSSTPSTSTGDGDLVGTIKPWAGMTAPNQYAFTYGQEINRTTYATLYTAITSTQSIFCNSGSAVLSGLADTTNFWIGMSVEVSCVAAGYSTVISKTSSSVTLAANANVTTNTNATFFPWGRGNGSTTFNLPDFRGLPIAGNNNMGGVASSVLTTTYFGATNPNSIGALGGNQSATLLTANLPPYTPAGSITNGAISFLTGNISSASGGGNSLTTGGFSATASLATYMGPSTQATSTFTGTAAAGQISTPFSLIQPIKTANYIIKISPDANSATASGVTSLGGMTGSIACGAGITCTGNTVSVISVIPAQPYIMPQTYGALCDGVTNDAVALQAWLDALPNNTGYLPPGASCVTHSTLTVSSNTTIIGGGRNVSGVRGATTGANPIFSMLNVSNISFSDFYCSGTDQFTSWASSNYGCFNLFQDSSAVQSGKNFSFRNMKFLSFNSTYWNQINTNGSTYSLSNIIFENNWYYTTTGDIPTDGTASNNGNYLLSLFTNTAGNGRIENVSIKNNLVEGDGACFGFALFSNIYKYQIQNNSITNMGATNIGHCVNGFGTANNSYPILVYDLNSDGNPSTSGLIQDNYLLNPYSAGIYFAGDGVNKSLSFSNSNTLISGNLIVGQSSNDDVLPRAAIAINISTNISVIGNKLYNNYGGISTSSQFAGTINISENYCNTGAGSSALHPSSCISIGTGNLTTTNTVQYLIKSNYLENSSGSTSKVVKSLASATNYYDKIEFSNNTVVASDFGVDFASTYVNSKIITDNNTFRGVAATSMYDASNVSIGQVDAKNNSFDLQLSTTGTGMKITNSTVFLSNNTFANRNAGAAFAFSGVGAQGTLAGMQFHNIATANQVVATSIGLAIPTWSASSQNFVQNLNVTTGTTLVLGWLNTSSGVNWIAVNALGTLGTGVSTALGVNVGTAGSFVVNGGALGTPASGVLTNATGYTVANLSDTSWSTYTPSSAFSTPGTSVMGAASGRWKQVGKVVFFSVDCTVTTVGTGTGNWLVGLPTATNATALGQTVGASGKEVILSGALLAIQGYSTTQVGAVKYDGSSLAALGNGARIIFLGTYEAN